MTVQEAGSGSSAASATAAQTIAWYVGRDGQQYGPVADPEFHAMLQSGQILPTDLVWRDGFAEWKPASSLRTMASVIPPAPEPQPPTQPVAQSYQPPQQQPAAEARLAPQPRADAAPPRERTDRQPLAPKVEPSRGKPKREAGGESTLRRRTRKVGRGIAWAAIALFFVVTLGAAYLVVTGDKNLQRMASALIPQFGERIPTTAPITGFATTPPATDEALQKSLLWQVLKKHHPDWYVDRVKEATEGVRSGKSETEILTGLMQAVVKLRRQYAGDATSAPITRLKLITTLFATNLVRLKGQSVDACFQYVSAGESAPAIVALLQNADYTSALQAQLAATFEGIDEGRRTPRVYPQPKATDYDVLVAALEARGWKKDDLTLFADSQKLAQAPPETVCRLVTEWFEAQIAIKEPDVQLRLIADSLRPVVAG